MTTQSTPTITVNDTEYDLKDFTDYQREILGFVQQADADIFKLRSRLAIAQAGRQAAITSLSESLKSEQAPLKETSEEEPQEFVETSNG